MKITWKMSDLAWIQANLKSNKIQGFKPTFNKNCLYDSSFFKSHFNLSFKWANLGNFQRMLRQNFKFLTNIELKLKKWDKKLGWARWALFLTLQHCFSNPLCSLFEFIFTALCKRKQNPSNESTFKKFWHHQWAMTSCKRN